MRARHRAPRSAHAACIAQEPAGLVVELARLQAKLRAVEQHRAGGEQRAVDTARTRRRRGFAAAWKHVRRQAEQHPLIGIADGGHAALHIHDARQELEHRLERSPVLRVEVAAIGAREEPGESSMSATEWWYQTACSRLTPSSKVCNTASRVSSARA